MNEESKLLVELIKELDRHIEVLQPDGFTATMKEALEQRNKVIEAFIAEMKGKV